MTTRQQFIDEAIYDALGPAADDVMHMINEEADRREAAGEFEHDTVENCKCPPGTVRCTLEDL